VFLARKSSMVEISEWESKIKMKVKDLKTMTSWTRWRYLKGSGGSSGWKYCDLNIFDGCGSAEVDKVLLLENSLLGCSKWESRMTMQVMDF
jgi:hypothetical protein